MTSILYIQSNIGQKKLKNSNSVSNFLAVFFTKVKFKKIFQTHMRFAKLLTKTLKNATLNFFLKISPNA
jgi:hypothetical protein